MSHAGIFHGWKRKAGVVTLLLACVFMAGWMRSLRTVNYAGFSMGARSLVQLISRQGTVAIRSANSKLPVKQLSVDRVLLMGFQPPQGNSTCHLAINVDPMTRTAEGSPYRWLMSGHGLEIGGCSDGQLPLQIFVVCVP